jgi:hypothetical protein
LLCLDCLKDGKERTTRQVALHVMAAKSLNTGDAVLLKTVMFSCLNSMQGLAGRKRIRKLPKTGRANVWQL